MLEWVELLGTLFMPAILAGLIAGLFGLGGGVVIVPAVYYVLTGMGLAAELAMSMSIATSLLTIVVTGFSSALAHARLGHVDVDLLKVWVLPLIGGAILGSVLVANYRTPSLIVFFGLFLWLVALLNVLIQKRRQPASEPSVERFSVRAAALLCVFGIGGVSTLAGVGGGTLSVPLLKAQGRGTHNAIGTSAAMGFVLALMASLNMLFLGAVDEGRPAGTVGLIYLPALVVILPCTVFFAPMGARIGKKISAGVLDKLFVLLLVVVGAKMMLSGIKALA